MSTVEVIKNVLNGMNPYTKTENGDTAYKTTLNANLDLFGVAGAARHNQPALKSLFDNALNEDYKTAIMNLLYLRDVRGGLGERLSFRTCFKKICNSYPNDAATLFPYVVEYGRYDDLFVAKGTPAEATMIDFIREQLNKDIETFNTSGNCSLLPKWMPSINASNADTIRLGNFFANKLGYSKAEYRKLLSKLRRGKIVENNLRERDYTFDYNALPSKAMHKYRSAFARNDIERYSLYLQQVAQGTAKINVDTLYPYEIIREWNYHEPNNLCNADMQAKWDALPRLKYSSNTIVVRDGSGSMFGLPLDVASSLSILFSEQLTGEFKDKFITFSSKPELVEFPTNASLFQKLSIVYKYNDCSNTDISKVYDLIYNTSLNIKNPKDYIQRVVIISDMEFDQGTQNVPTYNTVKEKFDSAGIPLPEIVYWNVCARRVHFATNPDQPNVRYVSGASNHVIDSIMNNSSVDAVDFMMQTLNKYKHVCEVLTMQ